MASSEYPQRLVRRLRGCGPPRANAGRRRFDRLCMPCRSDHAVACAESHGHRPRGRHRGHPLQPWAQHDAGGDRGGREPIDAGAQVSKADASINVGSEAYASRDATSLGAITEEIKRRWILEMGEVVALDLNGDASTKRKF
jgi:hypothetical protein